MNLAIFDGWQDASDFAKSKRSEGFKTTFRPFENGGPQNRKTKFVVRWRAA